MWLKNTINSLAKVLHPVTFWANNVGVVFLALMMFLVAADVLLRYAFNAPIRGAYELGGSMMGILVAGVLAQTAVKKGHINIDLLTIRLPRVVQRTLAVITNLVSLFLFIMIAWRETVQTFIIRDSGSITMELQWPVYPFVLVTAIGFVLLSLAFIIITLESVSEAVTKWNQ